MMWPELQQVNLSKMETKAWIKVIDWWETQEKKLTAEQELDPDKHLESEVFYESSFKIFRGGT